MPDYIFDAPDGNDWLFNAEDAYQQWLEENSVPPPSADDIYDEAGEIYSDFIQSMEKLIDAIDEYVGFFKDDGLDFLRELLSNTHARYQPETKEYD